MMERRLDGGNSVLEYKQKLNSTSDGFQKKRTTVHMQEKGRRLCNSNGAIHIARCLLTKKKVLLSRCLKTDSTRHNLLENPTIDTPMQQTSSWYRDGFPKQTALIIRETPGHSEKEIE